MEGRPPSPRHRSPLGSRVPGARTLAALLVVVGGLLGTTAWVAAGAAAPAHGWPERFVAGERPVRLVDTRPGGETVDGIGAGAGLLRPGAVVEIPVVGRGVPGAAGAVVLNVAAVDARAPGYLSAHPCTADDPSTSNVNVGAGATRASMAVVDVGDDGTVCVTASVATHLVVDLLGALDAGDVTGDGPVRLVDTRQDGRTVDGDGVGGGRVEAGSIVEVPALGRGGLAGTGPVVAGITVVEPAGAGYAAAFTCGSDPAPSSTVNVGPGDLAVANLAIVQPDADGDICVLVSTEAHLVVDASGQLEPGVIEVAARPRRVLDTRPGEPVAPGAPDIRGRRSAGSTTPLPLGGRAGIPSDVSAVLLNVTAVAPAAPGFLTIHPPSSERPGTSTLNHGPGGVVANATLVPVGEDGTVCVFTRAPVDLVIDVVGWVTGPGPTAVAECPSTSLFPDRRIVALYGNDASAALGVLGEQPPREAADRLAEVAAPYAAGDRPVQGAFELIATIATRAPGPSGLYRSVSSDAHVQRYLDVARERGLLLILDIQPGRGDFLSEVRRYERFLTDPIVHVALDPEWNVGPGQVPGEVVGQVDATEVNAVADYLAGIVARESLPDKLLVVHQFQDRMVTRRSLLREPAGVAVVIHMDGFGTQSQKLATYSVVHAEPPFDNGFKLFYDEDVDMFEPSEVLALDPVPDLITYQ